MCLKSDGGWILHRWTKEAPDTTGSTAWITIVEKTKREADLEQQRFPTRKEALQALETILILQEDEESSIE